MAVDSRNEFLQFKWGTLLKSFFIPSKYNRENEGILRTILLHQFEFLVVLSFSADIQMLTNINRLNIRTQ